MRWVQFDLLAISGEGMQPDIWSCKCKFFCVYRPYKEPISKEMNNNNHLNLHLHEQMSGWPRYCSRSVALVLAARNFGNGRVVLCTWETIIASSGFQLLWEGYVFWGFLCILYNIITIQYNLILYISEIHSCFIICTFFALI